MKNGGWDLKCAGKLETLLDIDQTLLTCGVLKSDQTDA